MKKSTKAALSFLAGVLIVSAGVLIYGVLTGRITSLADLVVGPKEKILAKQQAPEFLKGSFNNLHLEGEGVVVSRLDPQYKSLSDPVNITLPTNAFENPSIISYGGMVYLFGGGKFNEVGAPWNFYDKNVTDTTSDYYYGKVESNGTISSWQKGTLPFKSYQTKPLRFADRLCLQGSFNTAAERTNVVYCGQITDGGAINNWQEQKGDKLGKIEYADSIANFGSDFYAYFTGAAKPSAVSDPGGRKIISQYLLNFDGNLAPVRDYNLNIDEIYCYDEGGNFIKCGCRDNSANGCNLNVEAFVFKNLLGRRIDNLNVLVPNQAYLATRTMQADGSLSSTSCSTAGYGSVDFLAAEARLNNILFDKEYKQAFPHDVHDVEIDTPIYGTIVQLEDARYFFVLDVKSSDALHVLWSIKINDQANTNNFDDLGIYDGVFELGKATPVKNFIWSSTDLSISTGVNSNSNRNANQNANRNGNLNQNANRNSNTNSNANRNSNTNSSVWYKKLFKKAMAQTTCPAGDLAVGADPKILFRLRTAGEDGIWGDWSAYAKTSAAGGIEINDNVAFVEYQAALVSDENGTKSPAFDAVALTTAGEIVNPNPNPTPNPSPGISTSGTLPQTGTPFEVWLMAAIILLIAGYLIYEVVNR